jgi:Uncharacterized conserved protein (DUF2190)
MTSQQKVTEQYSIQAAARIRLKRFVGWDNRESLAGAPIRGVAPETIEPGEVGPCIKSISAIVESGAAISGTETRIVSDAQGRAIPFAGTGTVVGRLMTPSQTATAAGQFVEVMLFVTPN